MHKMKYTIVEKGEWRHDNDRGPGWKPPGGGTGPPKRRL